MYIALGSGSKPSRGQFVFINIHFLSIWPFPASLTINSFLHSNTLCDKMLKQSKLIAGSLFIQTSSSLTTQFSMQSFKSRGRLLLCIKIIKCLHHTWASGRLGHNTLSIYAKIVFPFPKEASHEIWLSSTKRFQRRRSLKMVN